MAEELSPLVGPESGTEPLRRFLVEHARLMGFVGFVSELATRADEVVRVARRALADPEEPDFSDLDEAGALAQLRRNRQLVLEMTQTRAVDNFLVYISELLTLAYRTQPAMLLSRLRDPQGQRVREQESVSLELVLEHGTIDELVEALVERRVTALAYRGVRDLQSYLDSQLGLKLFEADDDLARAVEFIEQRNLITHSRSVISRLFLSRVPHTISYTLGSELVLEADAVFDGVEFLATTAIAIDERAAAKWGLPTAAFGGGHELIP